MPSDAKGRGISRRVLFFALVLLAAGAIAVTVTGIGSRASNAQQLAVRAQAQAVPTVSVITPGHGMRSTPTLDLPGRIEAHSRALVHARVAGYLKRWTVDIGAHVRAGQLLAEIDTPELDMQLMQARAELASVTANAALSAATQRRWQSLQAQNFVSAQAVEEKSGDLAVKQAAVNASQANVDRLQTMKRFAQVLAPFSGVVTSRSTDIGALINPGGGTGTELFVVSDVSRLRLYVNVPQNYVSLVKQGDKVAFSVPERPGEVFKATVRSMSQAIGNASGTMLVQLAADNPDAGLLPGGFASMRFELPRETGRLTVPPGALIFGKAGPRVAVVGAGDKVALKPVTVARDLGSSIEIGAGLAADDRVIDSPPDGISDGDPVRVKGPEAPRATR
jgi:membrane fusion protein (multidrug efflux system)